MDRKKELLAQYKEMKTEAGVYAIRNKDNGKVFLDATTNLRMLTGRRLMLEGGTHPCRALQEEWTQYGGSCFEIEVLEVLPEKDGESTLAQKERLAEAKRAWMKELQPYGTNGYHVSENGTSLPKA